MRHFPEYDLYICGDAHFAYAEEVRNLIREKQVTNVFLTDVITQSEKIWLYRNCEAFLFPSEGEGFGLPVVEAMEKLYLLLIALVCRKFVMDMPSCGNIWIQNLWCKVSGNICLISIKMRNA